MSSLILVLTAVLFSSAQDFLPADAMFLSGDISGAEAELLYLIEDGAVDIDEALFRLCGIYHATGRETEGIQLLSDLEYDLHRDLTGWKVSLLDLGRRGEDAMALVTDDALLALWLARNSSEEHAVGVLPAPESAAERAVRAMSCPDGTMSASQIGQTIVDAAFLTFLAGEVCDELEHCVETAGSWWDDAAMELSETVPGDQLDILIARRREHLCSGSEEYWTSLLDSGDEREAAAARMLLVLAPETWSASWRVTDALVENGMPLAAESLAARQGPGSHFVTGVRMALLRGSGRYGELLALCDSLEETVPDSLHARALLYRARALRALQHPSSVYSAAYLDFALAHPWHPKASEAAYLAAKHYDSERNWPFAADAYLAGLSSGGYGGSLASWRGGFCHYMCGRGSTGDSIWAAAISENPFSVWTDEMLFWRARYANRTGETEREEELLTETAETHPWEFYGLLAAERLGMQLPTVSAVTAMDPGEDPLLRVAVEMCSNGYGAMASSMLRWSGTGSPGPRAAALALMGEHGRSLSLLREWDTSMRAEGAGILPEDFLAFYFPAPYLELTEALTLDLSVPTTAVTALMRQESYFNRWAGSSVGARGLIQLMPGTAGDISRWYGLPVLSGDDFYDPENSIRYGAIYLDRQYGSLDGSVLLSLGAYNAGPGSVARWMEEFPMEPGDPELFIEQVPFVETRRYMKKVLACMLIYGAVQ